MGKEDQPARDHEQLFERFYRADGGKASGSVSKKTSFVVVGASPGSKAENAAKQLVEGNGGRVAGSVSKATDYLVVGAEAGTKLAKAEKLGTKLLDEAAFTRLLENGPSALEAGPAESADCRHRASVRPAQPRRGTANGRNMRR